MKITPLGRGTNGRRAVLRWTAVAAAAALSISLAACSSSGSGSSDGSIIAWGTTADKVFIQPSVEQWNKDHPTEQIKTSYFGTNDFKSKIRTAVSSPQAPQLIYNWGGGTLASYAKAGLVKDLTSDLAKVPKFTSKLTPSVASFGKVGDKTYALPLSSTTPVILYYNKSVLQSAGIAKPPATWNDLLADVTTLKGKGVAPIALGGGSQWPYLMWLEYLVDRIGGPSVFQNILDNKANAWSNPAVIQSLQKIQDLVKAGGFADGFSTVSADTNADLALMVTGKAGFLVQGSWAYAGITGIDPNFIKDGKLGVAPFPAVTGGKGDPADIAGNPSTYWAISSKATAAQEKTAFDYMTTNVWSDQYTTAMIKQSGIPPLKGVGDQIQGDFSKTMYQMIQAAPNFTMSWDLALSPAASTAFWTQLTLLFGLTESPQQFADNMNQTLGK